MNFYKRLKQNLSQENKTSKRNVVFFFLTPLVLTVLLLLSAGLYNTEPPTIGAFFVNLATKALIARIILNYFIILSFQCLIFAFCYKGFLSSVILGVILFVFDFINQVMAVITGDPLLPTDLLLAKNLSDIASFIKVPFQLMWTVSVAVFVLYEILYLTAVKHSKNFKIKSAIKPFLSVVLIAFFVVVTYFTSINHIFRHRYMDKWGIEISAFNPVSDYAKNGALLTFLPRIGDLFVETPDNYSESTVKEIISRYELFDVKSKGIKPNVIAIQNEAWWDPSIMENVEFSTDPMAFIRSLENEKTFAKTGILATPVFAGGTCLPEFEFLTGMSTLNLKSSGYPYIQYVTGKTPSFIWEYKNDGYETVAIHPYKRHFYSRDTAYPLLGFDKFSGDSDMYYNAKAGSYITDESLSREIIKTFEEKTSERIYIFGVSMENHGAYGNFPRYENNYKIDVKCENMDKQDLKGLREYTQGVMNTDLAFKMLCDYFKKVDEPTLIVMYGDHLPLLGNNGSTYLASGMPKSTPIYYNSDLYFETPYVVWANYDISGYSFPEKMSASALGTKIYSMSGFKDSPAHINLFNLLFENISVYDKRGLILSDGTVFGDVHEKEFVPVIRDYKMIQYDLLHGKKYALGE